MVRQKINFDKNWVFHIEKEKDSIPKNKGFAYATAKTERLKFGPGAFKHNDIPDSWSFSDEISNEVWENVNLPHDYIIESDIEKNENPEHGFFKYHNAWYRKHFEVDEINKGKRISLFFEGVTGTATVYINGCFLYQNNCGFTPFEVDITDYVFFGEENVLAVYVDTSLPETWWYYGGGIYRHVYMQITDKVCVNTYGVYIYPQKQDDNTWLVPVETTMRNDTYEDTVVSIEHIITDKNGEVLCQFNASGNIYARTTETLFASSKVINPMLWDTENPNLYNLITRVFKGDKLCDTYTTQFGFRTAEFDPDKGFLLNGKSVKIKGVCSHQDFGLTGKAVPDNIYKYRISMLKEMGANGYRCSHYPHDPATMDALDELGLVVLGEIRHFGSSKDEIEQLEMTVKRDRNRPSVVAWLTGNEEMGYHWREQGINIHRAMTQIIKRLDKERPVSTAVGLPKNYDIYEFCDFTSLNYSLHRIEEIKKLYPKKAFVSTENCATPTSLGTYFGNVEKDGRLDSRDSDPDYENMRYGRENTWKFLNSKQWIAGGFQWDAFEHRGEATWPRLCSGSGAIDLFLRKKDAFYQNQSHWTKTPMVHIVPSHWNHEGLEGINFNAWVYTNCEEVELSLNGKSLGMQKIEQFGHGEWTVPYESGTLTAKGYIKGEQIAEQTLTTSGQPVALTLKLETPITTNNGNNIALVRCSCVDEKGFYVPDAQPMVSFECDGNGTVVATGSSNCDHLPPYSTKRQMWFGEIRVAVKPKENSTKVLLFATAPGLKKAVLEIPFDLPENAKTEESKKIMIGGGETQ